MTVSETLNGLVMEKLAARSRSVLMDGATKAVRNASYNAGRLNRIYDTFGGGLSRHERAIGAHAMNRAEQLNRAADNRIQRIGLNPKKDLARMNAHARDAWGKGDADVSKLVQQDTISANDLRFQRNNRGTKVPLRMQLEDAMATAADRAKERRTRERFFK